MERSDIRQQWEGAAPGWARWEATVAEWVAPATEAMFVLAGINAGSRVLDLACGAGSQTLLAARKVGPQGRVVASDISDTMLRHVRENALAAGLDNVSTFPGAAEELVLDPDGFDAIVCHLALMLFSSPGKVLENVRCGLRPGGKAAVVVVTTPDTNALLARPMMILLRHAGKAPPVPGQAGIFALGNPGTMQQLFTDCGFVNVERQILSVPLRMQSAAQATVMIQEAFGAYRAVVSDCPEAVRKAAWAEVEESLRAFETPEGFVAPAEVLVAAGAKPA
jgi:SAM-dependent methyltransferase